MGDRIGVSEKEYVSYTTEGGTELSGWISSDDIAYKPNGDSGYGEITLEQDRPIFDRVNGKETGELAEAGTYEYLYYYVVHSEDGMGDPGTWYYLSKTGPDYIREEIGWVKALTAEEIEALEKQKQAEIEEIIAEEPEEPQVFVKDDKKDETEKQLDSTFAWLLADFGLLSATIIIFLVFQKKRRVAEDALPDEPEPGTKTKKNKTELSGEESDTGDEPKPDEPESESDKPDEPEESDNA